MRAHKGQQEVIHRRGNDDGRVASGAGKTKLSNGPSLSDATGLAIHPAILRLIDILAADAAQEVMFTKAPHGFVNEANNDIPAKRTLKAFA